MILGLLSLVSCTEYDGVAMWNKNEDMGSRLAALEAVQPAEYQYRFAATDCRGLQGNDYVTGVVPVVEKR